MSESPIEQVVVATSDDTPGAMQPVPRPKVYRYIGAHIAFNKRIIPYTLCKCGSGKKVKFCDCKSNPPIKTVLGTTP